MARWDDLSSYLLLTVAWLFYYAVYVLFFRGRGVLLNILSGQVFNLLCVARHEWQKQGYGKACNVEYDIDVVVVV